MNDQEREMWVMNDHELYNWWMASRQSKRDFIRYNREDIDAAIGRVLAPRLHPRGDR